MGLGLHIKSLIQDYHFLAVQNSSLGDLVIESLTQGTFYFWDTKSDPRDLWHHDHDHDLTMNWPWHDHDLTIMTKTILVTCDIWDTDYNSDNWEPEFMTIFVIWQLIVTLDSIRNSCDVYK